MDEPFAEEFSAISRELPENGARSTERMPAGKDFPPLGRVIRDR